MVRRVVCSAVLHVVVRVISPRTLLIVQRQPAEQVHGVCVCVCVCVYTTVSLYVYVIELLHTGMVVLYACSCIYMKLCAYTAGYL